MKYCLFLDDSGQLHKNYDKGDHFLYGGLLLKENDFHGINASYRNLVKKIKKEKNCKGELKTCNMDITTRRRLLKRLSSYSCEQVFITVCVPKLIRLNFDNKKDVVRFKNYMVRRLIDKLIVDKKIPKQCELIEVNIDNQNIAHSSIDDLEKHLIQFFNEDNYYNVHKQFNTTSFKSDFKVNFKDSETNYLIQAADLLANTEFNILHSEPIKRKSIEKMLKRPYTIINLP